MNELIIPPAALNDPNAFEILRVWAAKQEQHVTINSNLNGGPTDFGFLLAELAFHGSKLYSQKLNISEEDALNKILNGFDEEIESSSGNPSGSIQE